MVQISLTNKGIFVLVTGGATLLLFFFSDIGQTGYEANSDVVGLRSVFVTVLAAVEDGGFAINTIHDLQATRPFTVQNKSIPLKLDPSGRIIKEEIVTEADLVSNYFISRRIKLLRPDLITQIRSEERQMPRQSSIALAMRNVLNEAQFAKKSESVFALLQEQDIFLHLRQISIWIDPLDATQEYSENLLKYVSVMGCGSIHGEPVFGVVNFPSLNTTYWSSLGGQLSKNLRYIPKTEAHKPLRIVISRSHSLTDFDKRLRKVFGSTPITIIPAGGSGYKMMELARGAADLYIHAGGARRWDLCAASAILQARGGVVRSLMGDPIHFHHHDPDALDIGTGVFAAASRDLFDKWASTVALLATNVSIANS